MSFSANIKRQLCDVENLCPYCNAAELAGIMEFAGSKKSGCIRLVTENGYVAKKTAQLIDYCFGFSIPYFLQEQRYTFTIDEETILENMTSRLMLFDENVDIADEMEELMPFDCCKASYIRGAFLGGGSISNPEKSYHLEFSARHEYAARRLCFVFENSGFYAKMIYRKAHHVVYVKEYETIADILGLMGAGGAMMQLYNIQIEKEMRNSVNRQVNCETANMDKVIKASFKQMEAINKIKNTIGFDKLPDTLREMAQIRLLYPEESLKELAERMHIGKSGVNHRLNRLIEIAEDL
ncbi:MAG: DNA-binding protein WhiA [Clostridia bacterium]|nr:DNA-binding protein WhiA [Clostridia bacterium]